ncbi:MAG: RluA family pseudouridine synthase [Myxococcales bacterium]|nr:RluA family pseudouridine synthase [Myxococcales bacterium]
MSRVEWTAEAEGRLDAEVRRGAELSHGKARKAVLTGKVFLDGVRVLDGATQVFPGARLRYDPASPDPARTEPLGVRLVYRDDWLLVVDKPAGLLSTPTGLEEADTALRAAQLLTRGGRSPKVVHRLDQETSGLLVFARGVPAARALRAAIDDRTLRRTYRCVVAGVPAEPEGMITSMLLRDGGQGRRGSRRGTLKVRPANRPDPGPMPGSGQLAITRYSVCKHTPERAALEVRLSTGRTHQIRIHLAEMGHPVLGERVYARPGGASRQALHAAKLCVPHPETGELLFFESRWPADLATVNPIGDDW